jgi:hypothetical protein
MRGCSRKEARTLHPNQILPKWRSVQQRNNNLRKTIVEKTVEVSADLVGFFEQEMGFTPYSYRKEFVEIFQNYQFTAARSCRQSGKTYIICALLPLKSLKR